MSLQDNSLLNFQIFIWQDMAVQAPVENIRLTEMLTDPNRKGFFEATPKLVPYWKSRLQKNLAVVELKSRSILCRKTGLSPRWPSAGVLANTSRSLLWITQSPFSMTKGLQAEGNLLRLNKRQQPFPSSSSSSTLPIKLRKWSDIPAVLKVIADTCCNISKNMTRILRHEGYPREDYGAIEWRKQIPMFHRENPEVKKWTKQQEKISVLLGLQWKHAVHACHPRPHRRKQS